MARYCSNISFPCPDCLNLISAAIDVPETYWAEDKADERYVSDSDTVDCESCGSSFEIEISNQDGTIFVRLEDHQDIKVSASHAEMVEADEDWEYELPSDPATIIERTLQDVRRLLDAHGDEHQPTVLNRMVFSQQVAAMEAYLGDMLLTQVRYKKDALARIVSGDKELKDQKLSLAEVLADPDAVKITVSRHLQGQLYHNLPKVAVLYRIALNLDIFPDADVQVRLNAAMPIRHDCVHRNGLNKDGEERSEVTASYVRQMETDIRAMVTHIEASID